MDLDNLEANNIIPAFNIESEFINKFPSIWDDKPKVQGLIKSLFSSLQLVTDDIKSWANGSTVKNAIGAVLDDLAYLYNIERNGVSDNELRATLLTTMASITNSGTVPEVIALANSLAIQLYENKLVKSDIIYYPNTRGCVSYTQNGLLLNYANNSLKLSVSSGCNITPIWGYSDRTFIPAFIVELSPVEPIGAVDNSGITEDLHAILSSGITEAIGVSIENFNLYHPSGDISLSVLPTETATQVLQDHLGNNVTVIGDYENHNIEIYDVSSTVLLFLAIAAEGTLIS